MIFYYIALFIVIFGGLFVLLTQKYYNPYKLIMIFGKKGSGKSTILAKNAIKHIRNGWTVYSTEFIPGTYYIRSSDIGSVQLVDFNFKPFNPDDYKGFVKLLKIFRNKIYPYRPKILLLVDEVGMIWDNRDFKNFKNTVRDFFKLQRHYHVKCILFSQTFDIDKKLRDLTDQMYLVRNVLRVFCYGKRIRKFITIRNNDVNDSGTLAEGLEFESFFWWFFGTRSLTFIPRWSKYFNSFQAPELESISYVQTPFRSDDNIDIDDPGTSRSDFVVDSESGAE